MPSAETSNEEFRVEVNGLNLRSEPEVRPGTRLVVLPHGQRVTRLAVAGDPAWWRIRTRFQGVELEGFVAHRFLVPVPDFPVPPAAEEHRAVHLQQGRADIHRTRDGGRAYPLGEPGRPGRDGETPEEMAAELTAIVDWLAVDDPEHLRYQRHGSTTFCNIYAHDYCYLAGAYLPRVWWTSKALLALAAGESVTPLYGKTVRELNANNLFEWLVDFGPDFGWNRTFELDPLQAAANRGEVGIVCAQRRQLELSGHVCAVVPETADHQASRSGDAVTVPLTSQAGFRNFRYGVETWWTQEKFGHFGFWIHP